MFVIQPRTDPMAVIATPAMKLLRHRDKTKNRPRDSEYAFASLIAAIDRNLDDAIPLISAT